MTQNDILLKKLGYIPKKTKLRKKIKKVQKSLRTRVNQPSYDEIGDKTQAGILRSKLLNLYNQKFLQV